MSPGKDPDGNPTVTVPGNGTLRSLDFNCTFLHLLNGGISKLPSKLPPSYPSVSALSRGGWRVCMPRTGRLSAAHVLAVCFVV